MSKLSFPDVTNLAECVLELVINSLNANATCIAIRIHAERRKFQVVDNGVGIKKSELRNMGEFDVQKEFDILDSQDICNSRKHTLINIRRLSDGMIITSRQRSSTKTYMKVFKAYRHPSLIKVAQRPSCGTTVSVHGFHELSLHKKWNVPLMYFLVANVALVNPNVSFTIRDDQQKKVIMAITKPHGPPEILTLLYSKEVSLENVWHIRSKKRCGAKFHGYVGLSNTRSKSVQCIFLNNRPVHCPVILQLVTTAFVDLLHCCKLKNSAQMSRENVFVLLFVTCSNFIFTVENGERTLIFPRIQNLLQSIRNCMLKIFLANPALSSNNRRIPYARNKNVARNQVNDLHNIQLINNVSVSRTVRISQSIRNGCREAITESTNNFLTTCLRHLNSRESVSCVAISREKTIYENARSVRLRSNKEGHRQEVSQQMSSILFHSVEENLRKVEIVQRAEETVVENRERSVDSRVVVCERENLEKAPTVDFNLDGNHEKVSETKLPTPMFSRVQEITPNTRENNSIRANYTLDISHLSTWNYEEKEENVEKNVQGPPKINIFEDNHRERQRRFDFLPEKLSKLVERGNTKLTTLRSLSGSGESILSAELKYGLKVAENLCHQEVDVRPCKVKQQLCEFRLKKEAIQFIKVLGQINNQLIAGLLKRDGTKILLLMDQHALHERIRYENLLDKYKSQIRGGFLSVKLKEPISIELPADSYKSLQNNKALTTKFGMCLTFVDDNTVQVRGVPECLKRNKYYCNELRLTSNVQDLLNEIAQNFCTKGNAEHISTFPFTIHNAIATEACHGAIKFGDSLTIKQCKWLMGLLKGTKAPTRCAHGRPSIIPILDLTELGNKQKFSHAKDSKRGTINFP